MQPAYVLGYSCIEWGLRAASVAANAGQAEMGVVGSRGVSDWQKSIALFVPGHCLFTRRAKRSLNGYPTHPSLRVTSE
jgi:hypothetical protein